MNTVYWEEAPPAELSHIIEACWFYVPNFAGPTWDILIPEGIVDIVFNFGAPYYRQSISTQQGQWVSDNVLVGQRSSLFKVRWSAHTQIFAVRLKAQSAYLCFEGQMASLTDRIEPIKSLPLCVLGERLAGCNFGHSKALLSAVFGYFSSTTNLPCSEFNVLGNAVRLIEQNYEDSNIEKIAQRLNMSRRTLERLFSSKIGMSPKRFARIARLHRFLRYYAQVDNKNLTKAAHETQYYDQSHFIREFSNFTGESPASFFRSPPEIFAPLIHSLLKRVSAAD